MTNIPSKPNSPEEFAQDFVTLFKEEGPDSAMLYVLNYVHLFDVDECMDYIKDLFVPEEMNSK